ncbi:MAG: phospholipase C, phosphocholine-specific [Pseudomonadota bacterium]
MSTSRRTLLQMSAAALAADAFAPVIARALETPAYSATGTIRDVEHVVILMQENRSFDHYFGTLRGVRGFGDPRPITLPSGQPVWRQPDGHGGYVAPFRLDAKRTSAEVIDSLDHSWKGSHDRWKHHDAWIATKTPMTMGYFTREDVPFYYALADAFTICDAYHCSIFGPTNPNRLHLFTGTSGLSVGDDGPLVVRNTWVELNETADRHKDTAQFNGFRWKTYAERLQAAGVSWKVYQEYDNYGDNALAYFDAFRGPHADASLMERGRGCAANSNAENAKSSRGEHLVAAFADDVRAGRLPQVSWIVAPYIMCEHPKAGPSYGQSLVARLLQALVDQPEVWSRTVFLINYDENDGFFDHAPPYNPAIGTALGASTVDLAGESYHGEPVGLGPRVPMLVVSPWSKGGWVNSQVFDHTSVLQFLERRFGVAESNITAWRRCVCGDLTSAFNFAAPDRTPAPLPDTSRYIAAADAAAVLPKPTVPSAFSGVTQEPGQRPSRALPYALHVACAAEGGAVALEFRNAGSAGAAFNVYSTDAAQGPWFYTVGAGQHLTHQVLNNATRYDLTVFGPNGFVRGFRAGLGPTNARVSAQADYDAASKLLVLNLHNDGQSKVTLTARLHVSDIEVDFLAAIAPGSSTTLHWLIEPLGHWYDIDVSCAEDSEFGLRFAGRWETGADGVSDPMIGTHASL